MITLYKNYPYDNKYDYIKTFSSISEQENYFNSLSKIVIDDEDYIKDYENFRVSYSYDYLLMQGVNYLSFKNENKIIYAFITRKEYESEEVTTLNYEIDVIQTFMFDFSLKSSFIKRKKCEISEITDFDEGIDFGEHIISSKVTSITKNDKYFAMFTGFTDYYLNEDSGYNGQKYIEYPFNNENQPMTYVNGVPYPLIFVPVEENANLLKANFLNAPNLTGIIRLTGVEYTTSLLPCPYIKIVDGKPLRSESVLSVCNSITNATITGGGMEVSKSSIFDFYPYTYYMVTDYESEPLILYPQYLSDSISVIGRIASSHSPIERYGVNYYKGDTSGNLYYIENNTISMLPCASNGAIETLTSSMHSHNQGKQNMILGPITGVSSGIVQALTGNFMGATGTIVSSINDVFNQLARNTDLYLTPNTVKSMGTPSTRQQYGTGKVDIIKYTIQDKYKNRINTYISRYGNKFNDYATIDIKTYKGFIQFASPNLDTSIDCDFTNKIISILEGGVYIE